MAEFKLSSSRLVVRGDLDEDDEIEMRECCRELLERGTDPVTVDLSKAGRIASVCIGTLVAFWIDLREAGREGKIVPSPSVMRVLEMTGLAGVLLRPLAAGKPEDGGDAGADGGEGAEEGGDSKHDGARRAKF